MPHFPCHFNLTTYQHTLRLMVASHEALSTPGRTIHTVLTVKCSLNGMLSMFIAVAKTSTSPVMTSGVKGGVRYRAPVVVVWQGLGMIGCQDSAPRPGWGEKKQRNHHESQNEQLALILLTN